jgi:hypothetical protein
MYMKSINSNDNCVENKDIKIIERSKRLLTLIFILSGLMFTSNTFADDESDIMAIISQYGDLETDLEAQGKLMRSDRIHIANGIRQTDEAKNMANQIASRKAGESLNGGKTEFVTTIEGQMVSIHGDVAVASFMQWWNIYPHNQVSSTSPPTWVSLVLIREQGGWLIKHVHQSPLLGN